MILATIIRLEMAYPGVGILAGDSLQYLSIVTAHAVIMVFFMIMPLLFGAFGNFLLPTQLGVHDVAFPRLNSAAFWFLPAGLIMLCQLVCLDRRYQRMNCFNIRELESLLKGKFFPDLVNSQDYRIILNNAMINLRFKSNDLNLITNNNLLFNQYGINIFGRNKFFNFNSKSLFNSHTSLFNIKSDKFHIFYVFNFFRNTLIFCFTDFHIKFLYLFLLEKSNENLIKIGGYNFVEFFIFLQNFIKSEIERQILNIFYLFDCLKTPITNLN
jgi:hypothetical protein